MKQTSITRSSCLLECVLIQSPHQWDIGARILQPFLNIGTWLEMNIANQRAAQWERCVALSREPWICLFCDDDSMEPECVEMFYREMSLTGDSYSIYHFNVDIIDASGNLIRVPAKFPRILSGREFAIKRFNFQISSFVSEYIFARKAFKKVGGFQSFPRGWCSDDATWIKLASGS